MNIECSEGEIDVETKYAKVVKKQKSQKAPKPPRLILSKPFGGKHFLELQACYKRELIDEVFNQHLSLL